MRIASAITSSEAAIPAGTLRRKSFQAGKHSALSQKLLNEIAAARVCLLTAEKKAAYDAKLRELLFDARAYMRRRSQYESGQSAESLGLTGRETFDILGLGGKLAPRMKVTVRAQREDRSVVEFRAVARLDTPVDVDYYRNGGILQTVLRKMLRA